MARDGVFILLGYLGNNRVAALCSGATFTYPGRESSLRVMTDQQAGTGGGSRTQATDIME